MGSCIGIGLVYNNASQNRIEYELRNVVNYLISNEGKIANIKFSEDEEGNEWREGSCINDLDVEKLYHLLSKYYFGQLDVVCNILNMENLNVYITIKKVDKSYFGLLLDIAEEELIGVSSTEKINSITDKIIYLLNNLYKVSTFDYAFCDNEAEVQYSPLEFQALNEKVYSIAALPNTKEEKKIDVIKSNWNIDGLTTRTI